MVVAVDGIESSLEPDGKDDPCDDPEDDGDGDEDFSGFQRPSGRCVLTQILLTVGLKEKIQ